MEGGSAARCGEGHGSDSVLVYPGCAWVWDLTH